jgi:acetolactate synthase-1/2/3 large subunit
MNGAELLVRSLEDLKVERVFGYPGAAILPVFHALGDSSNEQSCAFGAAGISRATIR